MGTEDDLEDFMEQTGMAAPAPEKAPTGRRGKKGTNSLEGGQIDAGTVKITPQEPNTPTTVKLMKVISITRTAEHRTAEFELTNREGKLYNILIDEATARAVASLFD